MTRGMSGRAGARGLLAICVVLPALGVAGAARAQDQGLPVGFADASGSPHRVEDLRALSIDQLAQLEVTSVAKRPTALNETPAAIYVITGEDIRRSGATSLPEALRLAPNLEVARLNAYSWTVTARGFNSPESANKLLVLIDGRSVYEPIGSGVLWQQVTVSLENIDRIEVISGPGGTIWGANAVDGVINVIMRTGTDTLGPFLKVGGGNFERTGSFSVGGRLNADTTFRLFVNGASYGKTEAALPSDLSNDAFRGFQGGGRLDGKRGADTYSLKGTVYHYEIADDGGSFRGGNLDGRWVHPFANGSTAEVHAYYARDDRSDPSLFEGRETFDVQAQHTFAATPRHQLIWGGEYRLWREDFVSFNAFHFETPRTNISLGAAFIQDEYALRPDLKLTLGMKLEDNSYSGLDWLPNIRLAWQASDTSMFWGAVSRAVRTPNRIERELEFTGFLAPSPNFQSEKLIAFETGWRGRPTARSTLSISAFYNIYDDLRTDEFTTLPAGFPIVLRNGAEGETYGVEAWARYELTPTWRLSAGANWLHKDLHLKPGHSDLAQLQVAGQDPPYQAQLRSEMDLSKAVELDLGLRAVGRVGNSNVPAYVEADAHIGWRVTKAVVLSLDGFNLLHERHLEVWDPSALPPRYIPRSVFARTRVSF